MTSSAGRLFDAVAAIIGVRDDTDYQGQAAIELEACAASDPTGELGSYEFAIADGDPFVIDPRPVLLSVLDDVRDGIPQGVVATRFHRAVIRCIIEACHLAAQRAGTRRVALAGGVFMNRIVLGGAMADLFAGGYEPLTHVQLPMNDGAVSFGQAVVAWANRSST